MIKAWVKSLFVSILVLTLLSGCWDRRELDERINVVGLAIDRAKESGAEEANFMVTVQIPIPLRIAGAGGGAGGGGGAEAVRMVSATGVTVTDALINLQKSLNQQLFMGHTRVVAISKEVAEEGVKHILDSFRRDPSVRRLLWLIVTEGRAEDLLYANPELESIPISYVISLIQNGAKMGEIPDITLGNFYIYLSNSTQQPVLNYVRSKKDDVSWVGLALFKGDKLIGMLDAEESWILMQLRDDKPGGKLLISFTEDNRQKHFLVKPLESKAKVKIQVENGRLTAHYHIDVEANILEKNFDIDLSKSSNLNKLAKLTKEELENRAKQLIKKLQQEYRVDPLNLGSKVKAYHYREWNRLDWEDTFPEVEIEVTYHVEFRRVGMELS